MVPPTPTPSARLLRAAAAERAELARHRERLLGKRDRLRAELAGVEESLRELAERDALLDRLTGPTAPAPDRAGVATGTAAPAALDPDGAPAPSGPAEATPAADGEERGAAMLRGPAIRRAAVRVLLGLPGRPQALHYRAWYDAVRAAGFEVAGKDPLAVFLTQLSRSPVVRKGTESGVYELDPGAPRRLRDRLDALHGELRGLTAAPSATADLTAIRGRRAAITTQITQVEKALEEADTVLGPDGLGGGRLAAAG